MFLDNGQCDNNIKERILVQYKCNGDFYFVEIIRFKDIQVVWVMGIFNRMWYFYY